MTVSGERRRFGHSSVRNSAAATAIGTPMTSAMAEVISVPTTSGSAPYVLCETSQLLSKVKPKTPNFENAGCASTMSRTKKNAINARIPAAAAVRIQRRTRSPDQVLRRDSLNAMALKLEHAPVARHGVGGLLGLGQQRVGQLREEELVERCLALAEAVVQEGLERLGVARRGTRLARVHV